MKKTYTTFLFFLLGVFSTSIFAQSTVYFFINIIRKTKRCGFPKRKVSKIRKFQKRNVFYLFKHTRGRETQKQPVSLPLVLYIQFKPNIIFTGNQTDSLINVILVNMNITEV